MAASDEQTQSRLRKLENSYSVLNSAINKYHKFQPWLVMIMRNMDSDGNTYDILKIDTFTATATVNIPGRSPYKISPIMLTNFEYNKNGSAKANSFSLSFAFNPTEKNDSGGRIIDPMIIDKALTISSWYTPDGSGNYKAVYSVAKHQVYMRYGYAYGDGAFMESPEYYGQALKANSELRDGMIYYTITGYSSITYVADVPVKIGKIGEDDDGNLTESTAKASEIMANALYYCFKQEGANSSLDVETTANITDVLKEPMSKIPKSITESLSIIYSGKKIKIIVDVPDTLQEKEIRVGAADNGSIFDYLDKVSSRASFGANEGSAHTDEDKKVKLTYKVEEIDNELTFMIYAVDPVNTDQNDSDDALKTNVVFEYPLKTNNIVKAFTPAFNFEIIWSKDIFLGGAENDAVGSEAALSYYIDKENNVVPYKSQRFQDIFNESGSLRSAATFSEAIQYSYKANMTTVGIPADIPIGTIINVKPIINGFEYHYAGEYMVLKTTDRIDMNGYTTEYELFKLTPKSVKSVEDMKEYIRQVQEADTGVTGGEYTWDPESGEIKYKSNSAAVRRAQAENQ